MCCACPFLPILGFTKERKRSVKIANKKVYFLTVWASENREDLQCLTKVVDIEYGNWSLCDMWLDAKWYMCVYTCSSRRRLVY